MDTELFMECEEEELEPWQQVDDSVEEDDMDFIDSYCEPGENTHTHRGPVHTWCQYQSCVIWSHLYSSVQCLLFINLLMSSAAVKLNQPINRNNIGDFFVPVEKVPRLP